MIFLSEKLYTSEETASLLGISLRTLYRYLKKEEIEAETKTQSGTFRFTRKQIYKYLYPDKYLDILSRLQETDSTNPLIKYIDDKDFENSRHIDSLVSSSGNVVNSAHDIFKESNNAPSPVVDLFKKEEPPLPLNNNVEDLKIVQETTPVAINTSQPIPKEEAEKIVNDRNNKDLDDELESLGALLQNNSAPVVKPADINSDIKEPVLAPHTNQTAPQQPMSPEEVLPINSVPSLPTQPLVTPTRINVTENPIKGDSWNYFVNTNKDILDLAREINSLCTETGRRYAATMKGGLSLHHDIDEFNIVHFYVSADDLNWFVSELGLTQASETEANICLISTRDTVIFDNSYKLRGLQVVADSKLIQDLMSHNEKELAKTLL